MTSRSGPFSRPIAGLPPTAKAGGAYVMTAFDRMLKGGESGIAAIVPGKPVDSHLIELFFIELFDNFGANGFCVLNDAAAFGIIEE